MGKKEIHMRYSSHESGNLDQIIIGSYDDFVRMERRNLLLTACILIFSYFSEIVPNTGGVFGFSFENLNEKIFYSVLFCVVAYFFLAFTVYAYPSYRKSKNEWVNVKNSAMKIISESYRPSVQIRNVLSSCRFQLWLFIHYYLPLLFGTFAAALALVKIT